MSSSEDSTSFNEYTDRFLADLRKMRENDPAVTKLVSATDDKDWVFAEQWTQFGRDVSNSSYLRTLEIYDVLNDYGVAAFFRGLTRSNSLRKFKLASSEYSLIGVESMLPFLQNASSLECFELRHNNDGFTSEEFSLIWGALRDSHIKKLSLFNCGLRSIDIDVTYVPSKLVALNLSCNFINADGCREVAKLLRMTNTTLEKLYLGVNDIDDEGLSFLVQALQTNTSLTKMTLNCNDRIGQEGMKLVLKLLNDISSIKSTLLSNHTLRRITFEDNFDYAAYTYTGIEAEIKRVLDINEYHKNNPDAAARQKVIQTQLSSEIRAGMRRLQGLDDDKKSPLTDLGPLLLPELLAIVDTHHCVGEFFELFRTCVADLWTTINRKRVLQQRRDEVSKQMEALVEEKKELDTEIDLIEQAEVKIEAKSSKRARIA